MHLIMSHNFSLSFNVGPNHFSFAFNSVPKMFLFAVPCVYGCRSIHSLCLLTLSCWCSVFIILRLFITSTLMRLVAKNHFLLLTSLSLHVIFPYYHYYMPALADYLLYLSKNPVSWLEFRRMKLESMYYYKIWITVR